jgi:hypothetical protein
MVAASVAGREKRAKRKISRVGRDCNEPVASAKVAWTKSQTAKPARRFPQGRW